MLSKVNPSITELSIIYEPDFMASFITELDNSKKVPGYFRNKIYWTGI